MKENRTDPLISVSESHGIYVRCLSSYGNTIDKMHIHEMYEIYFAMSDDVQFFVNRDVYTLRYGDVILLSNTDLHLCRPSSPDGLYERYMVSFSPDMLPEEQKGLLDCFALSHTQGHKISLTPPQQDVFFDLADAIQREQREEQYGSFGQRMALWQLLLFLCRARYRQSGQNRSPSQNIHPQVRRLIQYIGQNCMYAVSLDELSAVCHYNRSYLCRLFRRETGLHISDYLTMCRLSRAIGLLRENESISNCARLSGFHSTSFFISVFRQNVGMTPLQFIKQKRRKNAPAPKSAGD